MIIHIVQNYQGTSKNKIKIYTFACVYFFSLVTAKECMCTFVRLCAEARQTLCSRLDCSTSYVLRQGLSINLYLRSDWLYWLVSELWGFIRLCLPPGPQH